MRLGLFVILGIFASLTLGTIACESEPSSAPTDAGTEGGDDALDPAAAAFIADLCSAYGKCCGGDGAAQCATTNETFARGKTFDARRAKTCLETVQADAKETTFCIERPSNAVCAAVFKEKTAQEPGRACAESSDCSNGDDGDGLCILQKCRRVTRGESGSDCIGTRSNGVIELVFGGVLDSGAICSASEGYYCSETTKKCERRGTGGTACSGPDISCVDETWCPTTAKQCSPRTPIGSPCEDEYECARGSRCANDGAGGAACVALEGVGGTCERGDECDVRKGLTCDTETAKCVEDKSLREQACKGALALVE